MAIDVGPGAVDHSQSLGYGNTVIDKANPANASGTITSVEIWGASSLSDVRVGTFFGSGTDYTCRDYAVIGTVPGGLKQTFNNLSIAVQLGDLLGIYWSNGSLEYEGSGGSGYLFKAGDQTGAGQQVYTVGSGGDPATVSIYAPGVEPIPGGNGFGSARFGLRRFGASAGIVVEVVTADIALGVSIASAVYRNRYALSGISVQAVLSPSVVSVSNGAASLVLTPQLQGATIRIRHGDATLTLAEGITAQGMRAAITAASLGAATSMIAEMSRSRAVASTLSVVLTMSADAVLRVLKIAEAALTAIGSVLAQGAAKYNVEAPISISLDVAAGTVRIRYGGATLILADGVIAQGMRVFVPAASLSTVTNMIAEMVRSRAVASALSIMLTASADAILNGLKIAEAALTAITSVSAQGAATYSAESSISIELDAAAGMVKIIQGDVSLEASFSATGQPVRMIVVGADIATAAALSAQMLRLIYGAGALSVAGSIESAANAFYGATVDMSAAIAIAANAATISVTQAGMTVSVSIDADAKAPTLVTASLEAAATVLAEGMRIASGSAALEVESSITATLWKIVESVLGYIGNLAAGDVLEINIDRMTVKLNGTDVRYNMTGEFWKLIAHDNDIKWEDSESARTIGLKVVHSPRDA